MPHCGAVIIQHLFERYFVMNYEVTKKYFKVVDESIPIKGYLALWIIGAILTCFIAVVVPLGIIGILMIALGILLLVLKKKKIKAEKDSIPTDSQYDSEVSKGLLGLKERALNKLGLDEDEVKEIDPITFSGYYYKGYDNFKEGADGLYRTNKYRAVFLFFAKSEVHIYSCVFNTTEDVKREETDVYFYRDIVSVATATEEIKFNEKTLYNSEFFKLTTSGGTTLDVSLRDVDGAQRSINAMRALLREKKQG